MLQSGFRATVTLLGLLATAAASMAASTAARADDRHYQRNDDRGYYRSEPQIRLGIDLLWGGHAYAPPRPPAVWYPSRPYYEPHRSGYRSDHRSGYRSEWRGDGRGHRKQQHRRHRNDQRWDD